jgi:hypothetical protein
MYMERYPKISILHVCYVHATIRLYHSTSSPLVMLSWAKKTFTIVGENVLRDYTTNHKCERIAFNLFSFGNALMGKENLHNCKRICPKRLRY